MPNLAPLRGIWPVRLWEAGGKSGDDMRTLLGESRLSDANRACYHPLPPPLRQPKQHRKYAQWRVHGALSTRGCGQVWCDSCNQLASRENLLTASLRAARGGPGSAKNEKDWGIGEQHDCRPHKQVRGAERGAASPCAEAAWCVCSGPSWVAAPREYTP